MTSVLEFVREDKCIDTTQTLTCDLRKHYPVVCLSMRMTISFSSFMALCYPLKKKVQFCLDKADISVLYTASS